MDRLKKIFLAGPVPYLWLALAVFVLYAKTLSFGFTSLDDVHLIHENRENIGSFANIAKAFRTDVYWDSPGTYYRPVLSLSFMADHALGGEKPFIYHLTNILFHLIGCCLLLTCLLALGYGKGRSFLFSMLFAVHPALSQAVGWIPGRNDALLAIFALVSFIALIRSYEKRNRLWLALHFAAFMAALFTKEAAVFIPMLFLLYLALNRKIKGYWKALVPGWAVIIIMWLLLRSLALGMERAYSSRQYAGASDIGTGLLSYIGKIFLPFNLSVLPLSGDINILYGSAGLVLLAVIVWSRGVNDKNNFIFGLFWFFLLLLPTFIPVSTSINFLEHRLYLPVLGIILVLAESNLIKKAPDKWMAVFGASITLAFGAVTVSHIGGFSDGTKFWGNAARTSPHSGLGHQMLGRMHFKSGRMNEAEQEYLRSLKIESSVSVHNDLALLYLQKNKLNEAESEFKRVLAVDPNYSNIHNNLALVYFRTGSYGNAKTELLRAATLDPGHSAPLVNLGVLCLQTGALDSAETYLRQVLSMDSNDAVALHHLGIVMTQNGRYDEAMLHLSKAYEIQPGDPMINLHLAQLYAVTGKKDQARHQYQQALKLGCPRNEFLESSLR